MYQNEGAGGGVRDRQPATYTCYVSIRQFGLVELFLVLQSSWMDLTFVFKGCLDCSVIMIQNHRSEPVRTPSCPESAQEKKKSDQGTRFRLSAAPPMDPSAAPSVVDSATHSDSTPEASSREDLRAGPYMRPKLKGVRVILRGFSTGHEKRGVRKSERGMIPKRAFPGTDLVAPRPATRQTWAMPFCNAHGQFDGPGAPTLALP